MFCTGTRRRDVPSPPPLPSSKRSSIKRNVYKFKNRTMGEQSLSILFPKELLNSPRFLIFSCKAQLLHKKIKVLSIVLWCAEYTKLLSAQHSLAFVGDINCSNSRHLRDPLLFLLRRLQNEGPALFQSLPPLSWNYPYVCLNIKLQLQIIKGAVLHMLGPVVIGLRKLNIMPH